MAVAHVQVRGYYLALKSHKALVFVLSVADIELVMFPFEEVGTKSQLVNAVRFTKVPLWLSEYRTDFSMSVLGIMYLVLRITVEERFTGRFLAYTYSSGGFRGVRGVQMHPPLVASLSINVVLHTLPAGSSNNNQS